MAGTEDDGLFLNLVGQDDTSSSVRRPPARSKWAKRAVRKATPRKPGLGSVLSWKQKEAVNARPVPLLKGYKLEGNVPRGKIPAAKQAASSMQRALHGRITLPDEEHQEGEARKVKKIEVQPQAGPPLAGVASKHLNERHPD